MTLEATSLPRHGSLRSKLIRSIIVMVLTSGVGMLAVVAVIVQQLSARNLAALEDQIGKTLNSKGRSLADSQSVAFRNLVADNALTDMHNSLVSLRTRDEDVLYGLFVGPQGQPWVYASPTRPGDILRPETAFAKVDVAEVSRELGLPPEALVSRDPTVRQARLFGQDVREFVAPVMDEDRMVGTLRFGVSTRRMQQALAEARRTETAALTVALGAVGGLVLVALVLGIWAALQMAQRIARPIVELTGAAQQLARGDRGARVHIASGDELELLGEAFNRMVTDLEVSYQALAEEHSALIREVEERRRAEVERSELQSHLIQSQKMEAFGQLAGGVAHDFNNILHVILANSHLLTDALREGLPAEDSLDCANAIASAATRGSHLTRQLLTFARREKDRPKVLNINDLIRSFEKLVRRVIEENVDLRVELGGDVPPVFADAGRLEQVLMNLCVNARDAMPGGGSLVLTTYRLTLTAPLETHTGVATAGDYAVIAARDTGSGIPSGVLQRIFEPFFTTKAAGRGTGLGLATVHGIVRGAKGFIQVKSEVGCGTTFQVLLPACTDCEEERAPAPHRQPFPGSGQRILLCEDEAGVRDVTRTILERAGCRVTLASSPEEALAALGKAGFDLLLTDVVMPGMNGQELARQARLLKGDLPILYMSGYTGDALEQQGMDGEETVLLRKPFTPEELLEAAGRTVRRGTPPGRAL